MYELGKDIFNSLKTQADSQSVHLYMEGEHVSFTTVRPILEEVLYNLCDNAIKYNRPEGV